MKEQRSGAFKLHPGWKERDSGHEHKPQPLTPGAHEPGCVPRGGRRGLRFQHGVVHESHSRALRFFTSAGCPETATAPGAAPPALLFRSAPVRACLRGRERGGTLGPARSPLASPCALPCLWCRARPASARSKRAAAEGLTAEASIAGPKCWQAQGLQNQGSASADVCGCSHVWKGKLCHRPTCCLNFRCEGPALKDAVCNAFAK